MPSSVKNRAGQSPTSDLGWGRRRPKSGGNVNDLWRGLIASVGDFESIATVTITGSDSEPINFTSIPQTYKHLQIRSFIRTDYAGSTQELSMRLNTDSGANYVGHYISGNGSVVSVGYYAANWWAQVGVLASTDATNAFGASIIDILDYTNTNKNKTVRGLSGFDQNGGGKVALYSAVWLSTAAITSVRLSVPAFNFKVGSTFALYGIKG